MHRHLQSVYRLAVNETVTTTLAGNASTSSSAPYDLKRILSYAVPFSCLTVVVFLLVIVGIRQRHRVLEKWISLKRMRNTNPKFQQKTGLRRDSEYDSYNANDVNITRIDQHDLLQYRLETISWCSRPEHIKVQRRKKLLASTIISWMYFMFEWDFHCFVSSFLCV